MAEIQPPMYARGQCYTAEQDRALWSSIICEEGVVGPGDLQITPGTEGMSVVAAAGMAFVDGDNSDSQGVYHVWNGSPETVEFNEGSDPTDDRVDLIVARVYDAEFIGLETRWVIERVAGSPSPAPSPDPLPETALPLAEVRVRAGATSIAASDITDLRVPYTLCPGHDGGSIELGAGVNLDTVVLPGIYTQGSNNEAEGGVNYPPGSLALGGKQAGMLEVRATPSGHMIWQTYTEYHRDFVIWQRHYYSGSWSSWFPVGGPGDWTLSPVTAAANVSSIGAIPGSSYRGVNRAGRIALRFTWTGPMLTADSVGNLPDTLLFTVGDASYRPPRDTMMFVERAGLNTFIGRLNANGQFYLTGASHPGQNFVADQEYRINDQWPPT